MKFASEWKHQCSIFLHFTSDLSLTRRGLLSLSVLVSLFLKVSIPNKKTALQISGTALVLDEIISHVQSLQRQVEVRLAYLRHLIYSVKFEQFLSTILREMQNLNFSRNNFVNEALFVWWVLKHLAPTSNYWGLPTVFWCLSIWPEFHHNDLFFFYLYQFDGLH